MRSYICEACGTGFTPSERPPAACPICEDPRQYVPTGGQKWTTLEALSRRGMNAWKLVEPSLMAIATEPKFAIGQRGLILNTPQGNILWDCITLLDAATSGNPKFFLGTDSAPHAKHAKEAACGCAGCYTAHAAIELYAEAFEQRNALDKLEGFASCHGPDFYGLPRNTDRITLVREDWVGPTELPLGEQVVIPLRAGEKLRWHL